MKNISVIVVLIIAVLGCKQATKVETGATSSTNQTSSSANIRRVKINQTKNFNGMDLTIGEIAIEPDKVTIGMTVNNKSKDTLAFYPDQHSIVIGKSQLDAEMFGTEGDISGEINAGVERSASITFKGDGKLNPQEVKQIDLKLGDVLNMKVYKTVECNWTLEIK